MARPRRRQRRPKGGKSNVPKLTPAQEARRPAYQRRSTFLANETLGTSSGSTGGATRKAGPELTTRSKNQPHAAQHVSKRVPGATAPASQTGNGKKQGTYRTVSRSPTVDEVARCKARPPNNSLGKRAREKPLGSKGFSRNEKKSRPFVPWCK